MTKRDPVAEVGSMIDNRNGDGPKGVQFVVIVPYNIIEVSERFEDDGADGSMVLWLERKGYIRRVTKQGEC